MSRLKNIAHQLIDPLLAWPKARVIQQSLRDLPDGFYRVPYDVPYVPQFASATLINDYIHHGFGGWNDPNWQAFGSQDPADQDFWSHRICALACLKMAIEANTRHRPTLWQLVQQGLSYNGYLVHDDQGKLVDEGWYVDVQIKLANDYGIEMVGHGYVPMLAMCQPILDGHLVAAAVSPELGERKPKWWRYGGHLVLIYGFEWRNGRLRSYHLHNPSGRYPELQASAVIPASRFSKLFAFRFSILKYS